MLGQFTWKEETYCGLNFSESECCSHCEVGTNCYRLQVDIQFTQTHIIDEILLCHEFTDRYTPPAAEVSMR